MAVIDLCTVDDVKEQIQLPDSVDNLDALIPTYITSASRAIMNYTKREFKTEAPTAPYTRRFKIQNYKVDFTPWDLQAGPTVVVTLHPESSPLTLLYDSISNGYLLHPLNPQRGVYTSLQISGFMVIVSPTLIAYNYALMDVSGTWGFPSVPEDVIRATVITVGSWLTRTAPGGAAQWGIPGASSFPAVPRSADWHIPWAAKQLLGEYRRGSARWHSVT